VEKDRPRHEGGSAGRLKRRQDWFDLQLDLDLDQDGAPPRAWRALAHRRAAWALKNDDLCGRLVRDGPINGEAFEAYVEQILVPTLSKGDIVVMMDNLGPHQGVAVRADVEAVSVELRYLFPFSPDFNPVEKSLLPVESAPASLPMVQRGECLHDPANPIRRTNAYAVNAPVSPVAEGRPDHE
jgi:hypothetical protein